MNELIDRLKEIGLKEIASKTYISYNRLEDIVDLNFNKLRDKTTVFGIIKILEREYKLDFNPWRSEYENYFQESGSIDFEENSEINQLISKASNQDEPRKTILIPSLLVIALIVLIFLAYQNREIVLKYIEGISSEKSSEESKSDSDKKDNQVNFIVPNETKEIDELSESANEVVVVYENNITEQNLIDEEEIESNITQAQDILIKEINITIAPSTRLWLGVVFLDNNQKRDYFIEDRFELNTNRSQLLYMGHSAFEIIEGNKISKPSSQTTSRYYYDSQTYELVEIDVDRFRELNRGADW